MYMLQAWSLCPQGGPDDSRITLGLKISGLDPRFLGWLGLGLTPRIPCLVPSF